VKEITMNTISNLDIEKGGMEGVRQNQNRASTFWINKQYAQTVIIMMLIFSTIITVLNNIYNKNDTPFYSESKLYDFNHTLYKNASTKTLIIH
jgi:hypothetical protein